MQQREGKAEALRRRRQRWARDREQEVEEMGAGGCSWIIPITFRFTKTGAPSIVLALYQSGGSLQQLVRDRDRHGCAKSSSSSSFNKTRHAHLASYTPPAKVPKPLRRLRVGVRTDLSIVRMWRCMIAAFAAAIAATQAQVREGGEEGMLSKYNRTRPTQESNNVISCGRASRTPSLTGVPDWCCRYG